MKLYKIGIGKNYFTEKFVQASNKADAMKLYISYIESLNTGNIDIMLGEGLKVKFICTMDSIIDTYTEKS